MFYWSSIETEDVRIIVLLRDLLRTPVPWMNISLILNFRLKSHRRRYIWILALLNTGISLNRNIDIRINILWADSIICWMYLHWSSYVRILFPLVNTLDVWSCRLARVSPHRNINVWIFLESIRLRPILTWEVLLMSVRQGSSCPVCWKYDPPAKPPRLPRIRRCCPVVKVRQGEVVDLLSGNSEARAVVSEAPRGLHHVSGDQVRE